MLIGDVEWILTKWNWIVNNNTIKENEYIYCPFNILTQATSCLAVSVTADNVK